MLLAEKKKKNRGFTLVEMLVSLALFAVVTTIAFSALYTIMNANNKSKTIKLVVNNLNVAMESMTREIRVGYDYCQNYDGTDCDTNTGSDEIYFKTKDNCEAYYKFDSTNKTIKKKVAKKVSGNCENIASIPEMVILGDDIDVDSAKFYILGTDPTPDTTQPRVMIILRGSATDISIDTTFDIQTTVSQRNPDQ